MSLGSLFSGIGGLELGLEAAGLGPTIWQVEQDEFCRAVLARHWPRADRSITDVRAVATSSLPRPFAICGGFPCQDVSGAGKGAGLAGERSGLWFVMRDVIAVYRPKIVIVENVASGAKRWLCHVRSDLHAIGYRTRAVALSAFDVGAPHMRRRVFVIAAHPERLKLWEQQGWRGGPEWEGAALSPDDGSEGPAPYAHAQGELQPQRSLPEWRWSRDGSGWTIEPPVSGVAYGLPGRVDRERALGNAVVPQCGYVIGRIALDWIHEIKA